MWCFLIEWRPKSWRWDLQLQLLLHQEGWELWQGWQPGILEPGTGETQTTWFLFRLDLDCVVRGYGPTASKKRNQISYLLIFLELEFRLTAPEQKWITRTRSFFLWVATPSFFANNSKYAPGPWPPRLEESFYLLATFWIRTHSYSVRIHNNYFSTTFANLVSQTLIAKYRGVTCWPTWWEIEKEAGFKPTASRLWALNSNP